MKSEHSAILIRNIQQSSSRGMGALHATLWRKAMHTTFTISRLFPNGASKLIRAMAFLILFLAAARSADAQIYPPYYDRESWMAAQGEATFSSFETSDAPLGYFTYPSYDYWEDQGVRFTKMWGAIGVVTGDESNYGFNLAESWGVDPSTHALRTSSDIIEFDVTVPATSIAIECAVISAVAIRTHFADGTGSFLIGGQGKFPDYRPAFYGVVGTAPIVRVELYYGDWIGGSNIRGYLKSFSFGNTVPAPPAAILLLGGLIRPSRRRS